MKHDQVPKVLKEAYITPLLKKPTLDSNNINNCKPISNLCVLSKLLKKALCKQLVSYLDANNLMPRNQSAYRRNHSTELALTKAFSDIMSAIDNGNLILLSLMDLSVAFDCVDHEILLNRLGHSFGIQFKVLKWLTSYITGRAQCVHLSAKISFVEIMRYGVPQGSVLGSLLVLLYTADINKKTVEQHELSSHFYVDGSHPYFYCWLEDTQSIRDTMLSCISDIGLWMMSTWHRRSSSKTSAWWWKATCRWQRTSTRLLISASAHCERK